jgi:hypothetical protein
MLTLAIRWGPEEMPRQTGNRMVGGGAAVESIETCGASSYQGKHRFKEYFSNV